MDNQAGLQAKQIYHREYIQRRRTDPNYREREREYDKKRRADPKVKERAREQWKKYSQANKDKIAEGHQKRMLDPEYREKRRQNVREYRQTPTGKKNSTKQDWKRNGMIFTAEEFERIYNLYLTQELCNACDVKLTRGGMYMTNTKACCDHDHENGLFRHIICNSCNINDNWKKHFC